MHWVRAGTVVLVPLRAAPSSGSALPSASRRSVGAHAIQGHVVEIEADIENGLVAVLLVGLPDTALREARDRIRSAVINSGLDWPMRRITVGLSPASLPKRGSGFDVATAIPVLTFLTSSAFASRLVRGSASICAGLCHS